MATLRQLPTGRRRGLHPLSLGPPGLLLVVASFAACAKSSDRPPQQDAPPRPAEKAATSETWVLKPAFSRQGKAATQDSIREYRFHLEAGQFLELEIEQEGTDLQVDVWQEDGAQILHIDSPTGNHGAEPVWLAPERDTYYRLAVTTFEAVEKRPTFLAKVKNLRPATENDRQEARAWQELSAAEMAREPRPEGDKEMPADVEAIAEKYRNAAQIWESVGDFQLAARAETRRGSLLLGNAKTRDKAAEAFTKALDLAEASQDPSQIGHALHQLGGALMELDQRETAQPFLERALEIWRAEKSSREEGILLNDLALLYERQGQIHLAIELYTQSVEIWQALAILRFEATARTNLGTLYLGVGDRRQAIIHYRRSLKLLQGLEADSQRAWIEIRLGDALLVVEGPDAALAYYQRALQTYRDQKNAMGEAFALNSIGLAEREAQRPRPAIEALMRSLSIYRQLGKLREGSATTTNLASALEDLGQFERARKLFLQALAWARKTGTDQTVVESLYGLARVDRARLDRPSALEWLSMALALLEEQRRQPSQSTQRSSFLEVRLEISELMVELLIESEEQLTPRGPFAAAFEVSERYRARGFLDTLRQAPRKAARDAPIEAKLAEVATEINRLHLNRLNAKAASSHLPATPYDEALTLVLGRYHQLEAELFEVDDTPMSWPSLENARSELIEPGTLLLAYFLAKERSFVWSISQRGVSFHELPPRAEIDLTAREVLSRVRQASDPVQQDALRLALLEASRQLLAPLSDELDQATSLIVIPSGSLKGLPFAALPHPKRPLSPLVAELEMVYMPSVAALAELRHHSRRPNREGLAILSDPVVGPADARFHGISPQSGGISLPRLEYSAKESERIVASAAAGSPVLVASGFGAERNLLMSGKLSSFRFLHFAGHGFEDEEWPELSSLLVSAYAEDGKVQDGFLRAYEIRRLHIPAELVTLSACETASPKIAGAEGMFGLSRSFFDAGAQHVLMSLWPVHDAATAELMSRFYRYLLEEGETPSRALHLAQRSMWADSNWPEPFFWAAFVLYGDSTPGAGENGSETASAPRIFPRQH